MQLNYKMQVSWMDIWTNGRETNIQFSKCLMILQYNQKYA